VLIVEYVVDGEVIVLEILTSYLGNSRTLCVSSPLPHIGQALVFDLRMV